MSHNSVIVKLGSFVEHEKGKKPKRMQSESDSVFSIPYINIKAFEQGIVDKYTDGENCIFCDEDNFLMVWDGSRSGYVGKGIYGALGSTLMKLNFPGIENDYAYYFLSSKYLEINTRAKGTGTPHVDSSLLWNYNFPIYPLPEQRAIVAKIEQLFSELDNGIENLKAAKEQLKIYRQAVLKKAFEGGWEKKKIRDACKNVKVGIVIKPKRFYSPDGKGIPAFRSANVHEFHVEDSNWVYFSNEANEQNKRTQVNEGDVLIVRSGYPGTSCVVPNRYAGSNAIDILIATPDSEQLLSKFLCAYNNSPYGKEQFGAGSRGVAQKHLNVGVYSNLLIPVPPLDEQHRIVEEIETRLSVADKLADTINENIAKAESLRQSILKKAFNGELLSAAELEACRNEPDWEPAEKLLERKK